MQRSSRDVSFSSIWTLLNTDYRRVGRWHFLLLLYYGVFVPHSLRRMESLLENEYYKAWGGRFGTLRFSWPIKIVGANLLEVWERPVIDAYEANVLEKHVGFFEEIKVMMGFKKKQYVHEQWKSEGMARFDLVFSWACVGSFEKHLFWEI